MELRAENCGIGTRIPDVKYFHPAYGISVSYSFLAKHNETGVLER